jgi:hypothetical protein
VLELAVIDGRAVVCPGVGYAFRRPGHDELGALRLKHARLLADQAQCQPLSQGQGGIAGIGHGSTTTASQVAAAG